VKILHVVAPAAVGGLERVVQMLATGLAGSDHEVHVACVSADAEASEAFLAPLTSGSPSVRAHTIAIPGRGYSRERSAIAALCRQIGPDIVHTHGYRPDVIDAGVARRLGIPIVTTAHGFVGGTWRYRTYEFVQRRAFRRFDAVVAVSRTLGERLARAGVPPVRLHVVPNAWRRFNPALDRNAARQALGLPREGFVIGWVGRLSAEKGPDVLLDALPALNSLPLTVCVIGGGGEQPALAERAAKLGVAERIRWRGVVPDADRVFTAFDVFVLSSRTEGTPVVLFEAMASSVPVVTTTVGGVPDVVSDQEALLVPAENPRQLAAALHEVFEQPSQAAHRARAAQARVTREFGVERWLERYREIYRRVSPPPRCGASAPAVA